MSPTPVEDSRWDFDPSTWTESDCVGMGADLEPATIIHAYRLGMFPMPHDGQLLWWSPVQRGVLIPSEFRITRSLRRSAKRFMITVDTDFERVIDHCADPRRPGSWISPSIRAAYLRLFQLGWAHSVEVRDADGHLAGGLYGLAIGGLFAGESMFYLQRDASKVALMGLVDIVGPTGLIDVQWLTPHLASLGAVEWPREAYRERLAKVLDQPLPARWR